MDRDDEPGRTAQLRLNSKKREEEALQSETIPKEYGIEVSSLVSTFEQTNN